jgi:hypothetical protein
MSDSMIGTLPVETLLCGMDHQTMQGSSPKSLYTLPGIAGALVGAKIADAVEFYFLGFGPAIGAIPGAAFFVIGWRQLQPRSEAFLLMPSFQLDHL